MPSRSGSAPLVSVIVPAYQVATHLHACVRSIVAQTYSNLDIILVDDGATDRSPEICDEWARADPRVRVLHTTNGGLPVARNNGLDVSRGDFVTFVDGDDVIAPEHVAHLLAAATQTGASLVTADLVRFSEGDTSPAFRALSRVDAHSSGDVLMSIVRSGVGIASCGKLIASDLFSDLRFRPGADFEDLEILPRLFARTATVAVSDAAEYGYRQRPGSLMHGHRRMLRRSLLDVLSSNIRFTRERGSYDAEATERLVVGYVLHALRILEAASSPGVDREPGYDMEYRRFMVKHAGALFRSHEIAGLYKAAAIISIISPTVFIRGVMVAARLKSTVAPNLRRGRGVRPLQD